MATIAALLGVFVAHKLLDRAALWSWIPGLLGILLRCTRTDEMVESVMGLLAKSLAICRPQPTHLKLREYGVS